MSALAVAHREGRVGECFGRAAHHYNAHASIQSEMADWLAEWLPQSCQGSGIEFGAGTGLFTRKLRDRVERLCATDVSATMCAEGGRQCPDARWEQMDASEPWGGPWDWVFSSSMLQWMEDPQSVFQAWHDVASAKGRLVAGWYTEPSLPELRDLMDGWSPVDWRSPEVWREAVTSAGWRIERMESHPVRMEYDSAKTFLRSLHGVGATPERKLTPGRLRNLLRDYEQRHRSPRGVYATWTFLRLEAVVS